MKSVVRILLSIFALSLLCSCTIVSRQDQKSKVRTVSVSGVAAVQVEPDMEVIEFGVTTSGWNAKQIVSDNDVITDRFVQAVKNVGVADDDIFQTECIISNPNGYEARRNVIVNARNISLVPSIVDCKTALIRLKSVSFEKGDTSGGVRNARTKAIQNAQDAAALLAGASGSRLGNVMNISGDEVVMSKTEDNKIEIKASVKVDYSLE